MPDPSTSQQPQRSLWETLAPFALGLGSLAAGFGVGRSPQGDPSLFMQPLKAFTDIQQQQATQQHYRALEEQAKQQQALAQQKYMLDLQRFGMEQGQFGLVFPLIQQRLGQQPTGQLPQPATPSVGPSPPSASGEFPPSLPDISLQAGGAGIKFPGTQPDEVTSWFMSRYYQNPTTPDVILRDAAAMNQRLTAAGRPLINLTKDVLENYMKALQFGAPHVWRRWMLQQRAVEVPPEVAGDILQQGGGPVVPGQPQVPQAPTALPPQAPITESPFERQAQREIGRAVEKETAVGTAREQVQRQFARLPEAERTILREQDDVLINSAAALDLRQSLEKRYGATPGFIQGILERGAESLGIQDPELARFLSVYGQLNSAVRKRLAGTAVSESEQKALEIWLKNPRANLKTIFQGIENIFRVMLTNEARTMAGAQTYGGEREALQDYGYFKILERRKAGGPLYPELSKPPSGEAGGSAPLQRYRLDPTTGEPVPVP